jgi:hypothetical protein
MRRLSSLFVLTVVVSLILTACGGRAEPTTNTPKPKCAAPMGWHTVVDNEVKIDVKTGEQVAAVIIFTFGEDDVESHIKPASGFATEAALKSAYSYAAEGETASISLDVNGASLGIFSYMRCSGEIFFTLHEAEIPKTG